MPTVKNIFVVALDDFQRHQLETIHNPNEHAFHNLLSYDDVIHKDEYPIDEILDEARRQLDAFDGSVDAIVGHWDFPTTAIVSILCAERGLRAPSLESMLKCEHKYWCRIMQRESAPEMTPAFDRFDPYDDRAFDELDLDYPFWIKPIKAYSSHLGFRIESREQFDEAVARIRAEVHRFGDPFETVMHRIDLPDEIAESHGTDCIAEEYCKGVELAHEGHAFEGRVRLHGTLDMVRAHETFLGYEYPSEVPQAIQDRIADAGMRLIRHIGLDNGVFNAEYFWDPETDVIRFIEVNPRMSQSHSYMFHTVDGSSDHEVLVDIALGNEPTFVPRRGKYSKAGKMFLRSYNDGIVRRVPTPDELARIRSEIPDSFVHVVVEPGQRLADLKDQDAYSFELAEIYVPALDHDELMLRYQRMIDMLPFEIVPVEDLATGDQRKPAARGEACP